MTTKVYSMWLIIKPYLFDLLIKILYFIFHCCVYIQVVQCRKLLYEMANISSGSDPPDTKPDGWKKACAAVLALTVSKYSDIVKLL